jgi:crotonobetainyl-CoA:carnitine CoA-transferase CaiB-like acyl-CoA transferase
MSEQMLSGIKVLDLTWHIAGPFCTKMLADYGADVIKVERPGTGDLTRCMGPFLGNDAHPEKSGLFAHLNVNKRGITLNLKNQAGRKIFKELVKEADLLVESFRPHVMAGLGFGYDVLKELNPKLVMASISSFGQTGPYKEFKATDIVNYAMGGPMFDTGLPEREPVKMGGTLTTSIGGNVAAPLILGALWAAQDQGIGQHVDISLFEIQLGQAERRPNSLLGYAYSGFVTVRTRGGGTLGIPYAAYPCADGYVQFMTMPEWWPRVARMMDRPDILTDPRFAQFDDRLRNQEVFEGEVLLPWLLAHSKQEVTEAAQREREAALPVSTMADLFVDPQLASRGFFIDIDHPVMGSLKFTGATCNMGDGGWKLRMAAPLLGQHNAEVYGPLGYRAEDLVKLRENGAV